MGDTERWPVARGLSPEGSQSFNAAFAAFQAKGDEWWTKAELGAAELITAIQPSPASEQRREAVVSYVTKLIKSCVNCEVVRFGSVPLKTYLPDGDIDLTVVSPNPEVKRTWFDDVHNVLQKEIANPNAEFRVTEVHGVPDAEVKLLKIYVAKLLVDVSFDQLGGVCTLCFLEEVDRLIGDDHLFKRSIILVKAWCYYESRLLDAANNLMSTYALETLVLYIFHIFHASIRGPLQVLYLFLEFFSCFDWDKYCVSLSSPILLASFSEEPERRSNIVEDFQKLALSPRGDGGELLFTKAFLDACERVYGGLIPVNQRSKPNKFAVKSLNIIDPLRNTNNLGRSVNQGNCARIRRAFVHGARTMRSILHASEAEFSSELNQFFKNCNSRSNQRLDVAGPRSSWQPKLANGVHKIGGAKRDTAKTERNGDNSLSSVQNGYPLQRSSPNHYLHAESTCADPRELTVQETPREVLDSGMDYEGARTSWSKPCAPAAESASAKEVNVIPSAANLKPVSAHEVALNFKDTKIASKKDSGSNGFVSHTPQIDNERMKIPTQICSSETVSHRLPIASGPYPGDELSPGVFNERNGSGHKPRGKSERRDLLVAHLDSAGVSKQVSMANGNCAAQHRANGSITSFSRVDSEEEEECSSQSSSKGEVITSEDSTVPEVPSLLEGSSLLVKEGLLPLPCRPVNFGSTRNGTSSLLQYSSVDQHSTSDFAFQTEVQAQLFGKQKVSAGNEEERELSASVEICNQAGNGCEYSGVDEASSSRMRSRKAKIHQQNGIQSKDPDGSGIVHGRSKRGPGKAKGAWPVDDGKEKAHGRGGLVAQDGDSNQVSSSSAGGSSCPQQSHIPASGYQNVHAPRHSSSDATGGPHFKNSQSRPYLNATGPGSFRHPLANYQFDPGTARMTGAGSGPSHSSPPQYLLSFYPGYAPMGMYPSGFPHVMYSPGMNIHKRNSPAKGDGNSGMNAKNRAGPDTNGSLEVSSENLADSPRNRSQPKASEQIMVGIVERLEAEGVMASTSSKRSQAVAARNTYGADPGGNCSEFLTSDLKLHLHSLTYGPICEYSCSPSLNQILYPAHASEQHAHKNGSWEGPGRPDAALRAQFLAPQYYASGPGWLQPFQPQSGYFPYLQPFWGTRGVELSPRPRGTGTYLPNTQLRQNNRPPGKSQNRGVGQNGSVQQEDKYHQSREHETSGHHLYGSHHRAPTNKDEAHAQAVNGSNNKLLENRTGKTEKVRDSHHPPKHLDFTRASGSHNSHPSEPPASGLRANPVEVPQPSESVLRTDCDLSSFPLDVRESCTDIPGQNIVAMLSESSESNGSSEELPVTPVEFLSLGDGLLDEGGMRSSPQLKRSASVGHSYELVKSDDSALVSSLPINIGEVIPTTTTHRYYSASRICLSSSFTMSY
ncbi:hypothetical protein M758_9G006000 [Ceratodon purpureus]|nr:hypothetical protein M758_9G006000 [Ceratodon purpureus]